MTDTKNNKDVLFYVRCKHDHEGLFLEPGQVYPVYEISSTGDEYKIGLKLLYYGDEHWFQSNRFEPAIVKEVEENIEKVLA